MLYFKNTNISIENLTMMNWPDMWIIAKNIMLKDCTFLDDRGVGIINGTTALIKNCIFQNIGFKSIVLLNTTKIILEDFHMQSSFADIVNSTVLIGGDSEFIACTDDSGIAIFSKSSNITLSGNVLFVDNIGMDGGALFMHSSTLTVEADANVTFFNNSALDRGGALYLSSSTFYISDGANITFIRNSALDKGGAIYIEPGITSIVMVSDDIYYKCPYHIFNCCSKNSTVTMQIFFANNIATNGGDDIYGASIQECSIKNLKVSSIVFPQSPLIHYVSVYVTTMVYLNVITLSSFI